MMTQRHIAQHLFITTRMVRTFIDEGVVWDLDKSEPQETRGRGRPRALSPEDVRQMVEIRRTKISEKG